MCNPWIRGSSNEFVWLYRHWIGFNHTVFFSIGKLFSTLYTANKQIIFRHSSDFFSGLKIWVHTHVRGLIWNYGPEHYEIVFRPFVIRERQLRVVTICWTEKEIIQTIVFGKLFFFYPDKINQMFVIYIFFLSRWCTPAAGFLRVRIDIFLIIFWYNCVYGVLLLQCLWN